MQFVAVISYHFAWDGLRKYPGPLLARYSDAYLGWNAVKRRVHVITYLNHQKYGPVVRLGPKRLSFNTITALKDIYLNPNVTKARTYVGSRMNNKASLFNFIDKNEHRKSRKMVGSALSDMSLRKFEPTMMQQIDIFLERLLQSCKDGPSQVVDMTPCCQRLGVDIVGHLAFGYALNTQAETTHRFIPEAMNGLSARLNLLMTWPSLRKLDGGVQWLFKKRVERFRGVLRHMIDTRMAMPRNAKHDLYFFAAGDGSTNTEEEDDLRNTQIWAEGGIFFTAGGSTTATAIAACLFYLSRNPSIYSTLASEIRSAFESGRDIRNGPKLAACKYLRAVIDETLRMSPPIPGPMWREQDMTAARKESLVVDGHVIPPGTSVGVGLYSIMHNPEYFPEPFQFRPDRWLESDHEETTSETEARSIMRRAFVPFAMGERNCVGKAMAYLEASLTLAKTIWYFDFEKAQGETGDLGGGTVGGEAGRTVVEEFQLFDVFTVDHSGPSLRFKARGNLWQDFIAST
ncbi:cytochrome P450 [Stachybotrys elegans]|uniref:Cytochrome P450 n=1 Tax=Stachybotrys elegans TaxID=80388 RepID=A0A8K0SPA9_9HYPO|nr:cytochrome P450 [Stachybotrys elegans]